MTKIRFGHPPMYSVPLPAVIFAGGAAPARTNSAAKSPRLTGMRFNMAMSSRKHEVDLPPVLLSRRAPARPVRRVIQHVRHLRRPEAADVAVEDVALDGRA